MIAAWHQIYQELQAKLVHIVSSQITFSVSTELCFQEADRTLQQLEERLKDFWFERIEEEIQLYKEILPGVIAEKEFYRLLNYANRFAPESKKDKMKFWTDQCERLAKFRAQHPAFIAYYDSHQSHLDVVYYVRNAAGDYPTLRGLLLARIKYAAWAADKLRATPYY